MYVSLSLLRSFQEVLSDVRVGHYVVEPRLPWHRIQNATLILRFIAEQTFWSVRGCTTHGMNLSLSLFLCPLPLACAVTGRLVLPN
jgi:hypothetical protein